MRTNTVRHKVWLCKFPSLPLPSPCQGEGEGEGGKNQRKGGETIQIPLILTFSP